MRNKSFLKICARILCLVMVLLLALIGCSNAGQSEKAPEATVKTNSETAATSESNAAKWPKDSNLNLPGTLPICKTTVKLRIGIAKSPTVENWKTNLMTQELEKRGNFNLEFVEYPSDDLVQKVELMVMAGGSDLPDVIMHGLGGQPNLIRFGQAGMIIPLNDYYKNLAYFTKVSMKNVEIDCLKYVTSYDGNIYGMYNFMQSLNNEYSTARIMIYEPWLKSLNLKMPETTDDLLAVLRAFKNNDPNNNVKKDEIPMMGYKDLMATNYAYAMMTPFVYTQTNYWTNNNGKIGVAFNTEDWRKGLRYTRQLITEGLLSPLSFTQDRAQMTAIASTDSATIGVFPMVSTSFLGAKDAKRGEYIIVPPLQGPSGRKEQVWSPSMPSIAMVITKNCKTPEAAFMLGDLMCSEEMSIWQRWGRKGIDWKEPASDKKSVYDSLGYKAIIDPITTWGVLQNTWWGQVGPYIVDARYPAGQAAADNPFDHNLPIGRSIAPQIKYANRNPVVGLIYNNKEQEIITELHSTIITYVQESFTRFVMGDMDIEKDWDRYIAEFEKMGLSKVVSATQSAYDRMNKK